VGRAAFARALLPAALAAIAALSLALRAPSLPCGDLCSYYAAGLLARDGPAEAAYDPAVLEARHLAVHDLGQRAGPFLYSPLWLLPARGLAELPLPRAQVAQRWVGAVALGAGLFAVLLAIDVLAIRLAVAAAFALSHTAWVQLIYGNWSFLLFALLAGAAFALRPAAGPAARRLGALAAALALHLKAFVLFALAPAAWGRRRLAAGAALVALLLAAAALPPTGFAPWARYGSFLAGRGAAGVTPYYSKSSLAANLARLESAPREWVLSPRPVESIPVRAAFWLGLPLLAWGAVRLREQPPQAFAFGVAWMLLFVPQIWEHTEIVLFAAIPALARRHQLVLAAALAATFFYNGAQQSLLMKALRGEGGTLPVTLLLWLYPAIHFLVLLAALETAEKAAAPAGEAAAAT
jgi:hypothetical protein